MARARIPVSYIKAYARPRDAAPITVAVCEAGCLRCGGLMIPDDDPMIIATCMLCGTAVYSSQQGGYLR